MHLQSTGCGRHVFRLLRVAARNNHPIPWLLLENVRPVPAADRTPAVHAMPEPIGTKHGYQNPGLMRSKHHEGPRCKCAG